jgi:hypothetical protein
MSFGETESSMSLPSGKTQHLLPKSVFDRPGSDAGTWHRPLFLMRDRWFESRSLQRGVQCEPDFRGRVPSDGRRWDFRQRQPSAASASGAHLRGGSAATRSVCHARWSGADDRRILAGKAGFQKADLMDYGSLYGMGSYFGR